MLINTIDISNFNAKQLKVDIQTSSLTNSSEWIKGTLNPIFQENDIGFKTIKIELYFKGASRDEVLTNISNLVSKLTNAVILKLDGYSKNYKCILSGSGETIKTVSGRAYRKTLTFIGYAFGDEVTETMNRVISKTINVSGNIIAPAIVEITPALSIAELIITGVSDESIIINNLTVGKKIIINGENGTVTVDGVNKFSDTELWEFPRLNAGANTITVDKSSTDITIKYKPRFI
jgi:phage-related protein